MIDVAEDDGEQVVEVVRDAAGQLADRLHLLRLAQRLLGRLAPASPRCCDARASRRVRRSAIDAEADHARASPARRRSDGSPWRAASRAITTLAVDAGDDIDSCSCGSLLVGEDARPAVERRTAPVTKPGRGCVAIARMNGAFGGSCSARSADRDSAPAPRRRARISATTPGGGSLRIEFGEIFRRDRDDGDAGELAVASSRLRLSAKNVRVGGARASSTSLT